jgi:hypothetical protein
MSVIEKGLKKAGLKLQADALPKEQRTVKVFQRLIAAMRAAEAEVLDQLSASQRQHNETLQQNLDLHARVRVLEAEILRHRLKDGLGEIEALTTNDRTKLLSHLDTNGAGASAK